MYTPDRARCPVPAPAKVRRDALGRRDWSYPADQPDHPEQYRLALEGREPAEALTTRDRRLLVRALWKNGLPDVAIAAHTAMTLATTARIRDALELAPHPN